MKTLNFLLISLTLITTPWLNAQTIVIHVGDEKAMQAFLAETEVNFEAEWYNMIATMEAEMNSLGVLEVTSTICCPAVNQRESSFHFMGETYPEIEPSLEPMVHTLDTPMAQNGIRFLGEQFPELPVEDMVITEQRDGTFYFMNEPFPALPTEKIQTPLL